MSEYKIIDTSKWQDSKVDYAKAKQAGYVGVILRIGAGSTKDRCFEKDYAAAKQAGLLIGVYHYTYSTNENGAIADAEKVLYWLDAKSIDLPIYYDMENTAQKGSGRAKINSAMFNAFRNKIKSVGKEAGLYTGESFFNTYFVKSLIREDVPLWIAKYSTKAPSVGRPVTMWQYTSNAIAADFYSKPLDRSIWYTDVAVGANNATSENKAENKPINPYKKPTVNIKYNYLTRNKVRKEVYWLQWELKQAGYSITADGKFGAKTLAAMQDFQKKHGLSVDKICGNQTKNALIAS